MVRARRLLSFFEFDADTGTITRFLKDAEGAPTEVVVPRQIDDVVVEKIGYSAFYDCKNMTSVTIPDTVTSIANGAFDECDGLISITIPDSVTSIENHAFARCRGGLKTAHISNNLTTLREGVFQECLALESINAPENITSIENHAFFLCGNLKNFDIPDGVTSIGTYAFAGCSSLESINLPDSVTSIGDGTFASCKAVTSVVIPNSVTDMGFEPFEACTNLGEIYVDQAEEECPFADAKPWGAPETCVVTYYLEETEDPADFFEFDAETGTITAFLKDAEGAPTEVVVPSEIDEVAVEHIGERAFNWSPNITSITIPNSVTSIGNYAFSRCHELASINIPDSVTSIGKYAFDGTALRSYTIPNGITSISEGLFNGCEHLESVTIHDGVTSIDAFAFDNCVDLTSVNIPDGVTSIEVNTFAGCAFTDITIPDSVTNISEQAFMMCHNLTSITIPANVETLDARAFDMCTNLGEIYVDQTEEACPFVDTKPWGAPETCVVTFKPAEEEIPEVLNLRIDPKGYSVKLAWNAVEDVDGYEVYRKEGDSKFTLYRSTSNTYYTNARKLAKGKKYAFKVRGYKEVDGKKQYTDWSNIVDHTMKNDSIDLGVANTTITQTLGGTDYSNNISWKKSAGYAVDGYQVWRKGGKNGKYYRRISTSKTSYKDSTKLYKGQTYYYKVRGYRKIDGKYVYTKYSNVRSRVAKKHSTDYGVQYSTISLNMTAKKGVMKLSWKKSAGYSVHGYQVWRKVGKNGKYVRYGSTKNTYYNNGKGLVKGKQYYYKVRGWRKVNGKYVYTKWSNIRMRRAI